MPESPISLLLAQILRSTETARELVRNEVTDHTAAVLHELASIDNSALRVLALVTGRVEA